MQCKSYFKDVFSKNGLNGLRNIFRCSYDHSKNINLYTSTLIAASIYIGGMNLIAVSSKQFSEMKKGDILYENSYLADSKISQDTIKRDKIQKDTIKQVVNIEKNISTLKDELFNYTYDTNYTADVDTATSLDNIVYSYASSDYRIFVDNDYYRKMRESDALQQINMYDLKKESTLMVVNKTFQKAMIVKFEKQPYIYHRDSSDSFIIQGREFKLSRNMPDKIVEMVLEPTILFETDCSTAKIYGNKEFDGDAKTPEGLFIIYSMEDSRDWTYEGKLAFGPKFLRIKNAIGIHGNGTDTSYIKEAYVNNKSFNNAQVNKNSVNKNPVDNISADKISEDRRYMLPEPLGIYKNNFGYGLSHGCIRLENSVINRLTEEGLLKNGTKVIVFENKELTEILSSHYTRVDSVKSSNNNPGDVVNIFD
ncbi:MAG: L,D-transpeptidase [Candidatus Woesearchaeota archaeon]